MADPALQIKRWARRDYDRMAEAGIFSQEDRVQLNEGDIVTMTDQNSPNASAIGKPSLHSPSHILPIVAPRRGYIDWTFEQTF